MQCVSCIAKIYGIKKGFQRDRTKGKSICAVYSFFKPKIQDEQYMVEDKVIEGFSNTGHLSIAFGCKS